MCTFLNFQNCDVHLIGKLISLLRFRCEVSAARSRWYYSLQYCIKTNCQHVIYFAIGDHAIPDGRNF